MMNTTACLLNLIQYLLSQCYCRRSDNKGCVPHHTHILRLPTTVIMYLRPESADCTHSKRSTLSFRFISLLFCSLPRGYFVFYGETAKKGNIRHKITTENWFQRISLLLLTESFKEHLMQMCNTWYHIIQVKINNHLKGFK